MAKKSVEEKLFEKINMMIEINRQLQQEKEMRDSEIKVLEEIKSQDIAVLQRESRLKDIEIGRLTKQLKKL